MWAHARGPWSSLGCGRCACSTGTARTARTRICCRARWPAGSNLAGTVTGVWVVFTASMALLHGVLSILTFWKTPAVIAASLLASLLCSLNLLLVLLAVLACSLWISDVLAFLAVMGVTVVSFIGQGMEAVAPLVQSAMPSSGSSPTGFSWAHIVWALWPKIGGLQMAAAALMGSGEMSAGALIPALVNVLLYCCLFAAFCYLGFCRTEII